jgi:SnoaL-like domain
VLQGLENHHQASGASSASGYMVLSDGKQNRIYLTGRNHEGRMMEKTTKVFMDYAAAFEQTYVDDDWSRLAPFFSEDAAYEVRGGPLACSISGRDAIFAGLRKSIDGLDRRCSDRRIELTEAPNVIGADNGHELSIGWRVTYQYGDAPKMVLPGRSVFTIADGVIVAMRDEYDEKELEGVGAWMLEYGEGLDGSYV